MGEQKLRKRRPLWMKLLLGFGVVLVLLAALWGSFWFYAQGKLRDELAAIAARGEPLRLRDIARPTVPPEQDAMPRLKRAVEFMQRNVEPLVKAIEANMRADGTSVDELPDALCSKPELRRQYADQLRPLSTAMAPAIEQVRQRRGLAGCNWDFDANQDELDSPA